MHNEQSRAGRGRAGLLRGADLRGVVLRGLVPVALGLVMLWQVTATYPEFNATYDEPYHIAAALEAYQHGRFASGAEQPPLARWAIGWLPHRRGVEYRTVFHRSAGSGDHLVHFARSLLEEQGEYWTTLRLARGGVLLFIPVLIFFVYRWTVDLYGVLAGCVACALVAFSPNLLAHAGLATVDFALAALLTAAAYTAWRWCQAPSARRAAVAGCIAGFAVGSKYSALAYLPVFLAGFFLLSRWHGRAHTNPGGTGAVRAGASQLLLFSASALLALWACFGFEARPLRDPSRRPYTRMDRVVPPGSALSRTLYWVAEEVPIPLQDAATGVSWVVDHARRGHEAFLLGEVGTGGWWHYFPVVLAVKTPLPFLLLIAGSGILLLWRNDSALGSLCPWVAAAGVLLVSMTSSINVGVRHILPMYPLLAISAASCFRPGGERARPPLTMALGLLLLGWHAGESWAARPDYLSYFNSFARGSEHEVLGDSNLDWGQDLHRLSLYAKQQGIESLALRYFGTTSPEILGLKQTTKFGPQDRPRGWVASSVTHVQGIYEPKSAWLEGREPRVKIGKSIWLYYIGGD